VSDPRIAPVSRLRVLAATVAGLAILAGVLALTEWLRHPLPSGGSVAAEAAAPGADPRSEIVCETPVPREGIPRSPDPAVPGQPVGISSNELYDCPETYDRRAVSYRGEVVGAVLRRDEGAWVQLNDDPYSGDVGPLPAHRDFRGGNAGVGVLIPHSLADTIVVVGGPQTRGDILEVIGVFHRVDDASGEVTIIRAQDGSVVRQGGALPDPPLRDRQVVAVLLGLAAAAVVAAERVVARRR